MNWINRIVRIPLIFFPGITLMDQNPDFGLAMCKSREK